MYIYICVYMYIYICIYMCIYIYIYINAGFHKWAAIWMVYSLLTKKTLVIWGYLYFRKPPYVHECAFMTENPLRRDPVVKVPHKTHQEPLLIDS